MLDLKHHILKSNQTIKEALLRLNLLGEDAVIFIVDKDNKLRGSLTDGDIRRGILNGKSLEDSVLNFCEKNPHFIEAHNYSIQDIIYLRKELFKIIPIVNKEKIIVDLINFKTKRSLLPIQTIIMAGGLGSRLKPLTNHTPKPLLKVGDKSIIDYNIERLIYFGIKEFWISLRYLGEQIVDHINKRNDSDAIFKYVWEENPLGTIGAVSKIPNIQTDYVLITNSDVLTNINYEDFFLDFIEKEADMSVVTIPYSVNIPYAVLETNDSEVIKFKEKPKYTYLSNAGIYLVKKEVLSLIPKNSHFNSTDLMEKVMENGLKLIAFENNSYWLDIGKPEDYRRAQEDIKNIIF